MQSDHVITDKTVAIMIIRPVGITNMTNDLIQSLCSLVDKHELNLLEDVAEYLLDWAKSGRFLLFLWKHQNGNCVGLGLAILHNTQYVKKMNQMHHSLYKQQTMAQYLRKVLWCSLVRFLAETSCTLVCNTVCSILVDWVEF
jgi:hypothetical protein